MDNNCCKLIMEKNNEISKQLDRIERRMDEFEKAMHLEFKDNKETHKEQNKQLNKL